MQYRRQYDTRVVLLVRVVLDTDVVVAAFRSKEGASRILINRALRADFVLLLSVPLMLEYEALLKRPYHLRAANASRNDVDEILDALAAIATPVRPEFIWRPVMTDPADEMVLETAVSGRADLIVTFNLRHFVFLARRFGIRAMRPASALGELGDVL
jgi:putative PIN family toxin of toxin-antitoxin system